jgi:hypothetical protein
MSVKTRTGTCDGCGKRRKLTYPEDHSKELLFERDSRGNLRRKYLDTKQHHEIHKQLIHYYGLCSECFPKVKTSDDVQALRKAREPKSRGPRHAYCCIGGPLDGQFAATIDFYGDGMYSHLDNEYVEYNAGRRTSKAPSMIYVHKSLLQMPVSAKRR